MAARYHPLYDGLWTEEKLEGAPFELYGFFAFLFSHHRLRPSGIYRVDDAQLAADTHLPLVKIRRYLADLDQRGCIVRDGAWIWVRGYFQRQPKHENLLAAAKEDFIACSSDRIADGFSEKYSRFRQWSADRRPKVARPMNENRPQSSTEQSSTEQSRATPEIPPVVIGSAAAASPGMTNGFHIPRSIRTALERMPTLGPRLTDPAWWSSELHAHPALDLAAEALKAEAWCNSNGHRGRKRDAKRFLHAWFDRAEMPR